MIDWTFLLTPLLVLPIVLLFRFIGCGVLHGAPDEDTPPAPTDQYREHVLANTDVIAYWRLIDAEGSTSAKDEKGAWNGDYRATALADEPPTASAAGSKGATGQILTGQKSLLASEPGLPGRNFDGGYVVVSDKFATSTVRLYTTEFTIEAWVKPAAIVTGYEYTLFDAIGFYRQPFATEQTANGFSLFVDGQGRWQAVLSPHAGALFSSPPLVPTATSSHVAITVQPGAAGQVLAQLFVNGALARDATIGFYSPPYGAFLLIGAANNNSDPSVDPPVPHRPFLGQIQEVVLYRKALAAADIASHFRNFDIKTT